MSKRVLCIITDGFEEIETIAPVDILRRAGAEVMVASLSASIHVTGRNNITIHADGTLEAADGQEFDLLLLPGGPHVKALREDGRAARLAAGFHASGKPVAAICAAPTILHDAGLLADRRFTSHNGVRAELPAGRVDEPVVQDGQLITSQGAGTSVAFGLRLVHVLCGAQAEAAVREGIML